MPDGKTLQVGTAHHLGSTFAKTYEITYEAEDGEQKLVTQTCYGISERCIAALISVHGDDKGLALPWCVAPTQVVIVPILLGDKEKVLEVIQRICRKPSGRGPHAGAAGHQRRAAGRQVLQMGDERSAHPSGGRAQGY